MSSQETAHVSLFVGNTDSGQRDSGHLAVSSPVWAAGLIKPAQRHMPAGRRGRG